MKEPTPSDFYPEDIALWPALATTESEPWQHRDTGDFPPEEVRTDGTFVAVKAITTPNLREMQRTPRGGAWRAKSASNLLARA